jgi:hypothetical protein
MKHIWVASALDLRFKRVTTVASNAQPLIWEAVAEMGLEEAQRDARREASETIVEGKQENTAAPTAAGRNRASLFNDDDLSGGERSDDDDVGAQSEIDHMKAEIEVEIKMYKKAPRIKFLQDDAGCYLNENWEIVDSYLARIQNE